MGVSGEALQTPPVSGAENCFGGRAERASAKLGRCVHS